MKSTRSEKIAALALKKEDQLHRLRRILQTELTDRQRSTLYAYYFEKKTLSQIAIEQGLNKSTVCRNLHGAEEKVKRFLKY